MRTLKNNALGHGLAILAGAIWALVCSPSFAAEVGAMPEKVDVVVTYV